MLPTKKSTITLFLLVLLLGVMVVLNTFLPQGEMGKLIEQAAPVKMPKWQIALGGAGITIVLYGILGFIGLILSKKIGLPEIWDRNVTNWDRFVVPAIAGAVAGILLVAGDIIFSRFNDLGRMLHPPFPTSIVASISAGIGEELIFRLFFISFWSWLLGKVILRGHGFKIVYWVVSVFSALAFGASHLPSLMIITGAQSISEFSPYLLVEVFLLNGIVGLAAASLFKRSGYLAAVGVHFWTDIFFHVLYGLF